MIRIVIVAGTRLFRDGLAQLIGDRSGLAIAAALAAPPDSADAFDQLSADVILLDMATPESHAIARRLHDLPRPIPIVVLGIADSDEEVIASTEAGAAGYVTRDGSVDELVTAIESAARGELVCTPRVAGTLARRLAALAASTKRPAKARLSRRECEIAALLGEDLSNKEIAVRLRIEVATVKNHVHNLLEKLNVQTRSEAARAAGRLTR
jgi:two-component system, NarL family, nitrate/nitrite response regulator NarL